MSFQFFDVHDVSWGTTGDSKVSTELGVVSSGKGPNKNEVEVTMPTAEADINAAYEDAIHVLFTKPPNGRHVDAAGGLLQDPPDKRKWCPLGLVARLGLVDFSTLVAGIVSLDAEQCLFSFVLLSGFRFTDRSI